MDRFGSRTSGIPLQTIRLQWAWVLAYLTCLFWFCSIPSAKAQLGPGRGGGTVYPETSSFAESLLLNARFHEENQQWGSAIELYRRVIRQYGDLVAPAQEVDPAAPNGSFRLYINIRQLCQRRLAQLPPEALQIYREQVDGEAEHWYRLGLRERDPAPLRRVVEEAFCSSWGDEALELLGDLSFQEGRFAEALNAYRSLVPDTPLAPGLLVYPNPSIDLSRVAAKKLLVRAAAGENPPDKENLQQFAETYPEARGSLAGRPEGPLLEILTEALELDGLNPPLSTDGRWPTFAGAPNRSKVAPEPIDIGSVQWVVPLEQPTESADRLNAAVRPLTMPQETSEVDVPIYHPIILGDEVLVSDQQQIRSFELTARPDREGGEIDPTWVGGDPNGFSMPPARSFGAPRFTLTAAGNRIFARMGSFGVAYRNRNNTAPTSTIVAVERSSQGKFLWKRSSDEFTLPNQGEQDESGAGFGGTPVADERNVYVALLQPGPRAMTWVACLDAETGATRWVRYICAASSNAMENRIGFRGGLIFNPDLGHRLLSLHGSTLYYQTDLGAVAAIDARSGNLRWLTSYPRSEEAARRWGDRDLSPAIVHDGQVIVAPRDSEKIFAFDADTGRPVWNVEPGAKVSHLLGVAKGRLVATGNHVWSFDAQTGELLSRWPDGQTFEEGYGRGLLADDAIYWPTRDKIYILDQETGLPTRRPPILLRERFGYGGGNLVAGDGYLVVAQADRLVVFCQNETLKRRYADQIVAAPDEPGNYFRLAQVAEATGDHSLALDSLEKAIDRARPTDRIDGDRLTDLARGQRYRLLIKVGQDAERQGDWVRAASLYADAAETAASNEARLEARLSQANAEAEGNQADEAVSTLQQLLTDDRLRPMPVSADPNRTVRAELLVVNRLQELLKQQGRGLYSEFDKEANELLRRGLAEKAPHILQEIERSYPLAEALPESLLAQGRILEAQDQTVEAGRAYKRLVTQAQEDRHRVLGLLGMARVYETQGLWVAAGDTYHRILVQYPDWNLEEAEIGGPLNDFVQERLAQQPLAMLAERQGRTTVTPPLLGNWVLRWSGKARPLVAEGSPPSLESGRIFLAEGSDLRCVDPEAGAIAWTTDLGNMPVWVGYLADRLVAATERSLSALDLSSGEVVWNYQIEDAKEVDPGLNPFAAPQPKANPETNLNTDRGSNTFHDFHLVGERIFCQRGDRELMAFDGDTGLLEWTFSPPSGRLNPRVGIDPARIVLQILGPESVLVLETETGRLVSEFSLPRSSGAWARDPFPVTEDRVALVLDPRTIGLLDIGLGEWVWRYRETSPLPRYDPPHLLGNSDQLLVLSPEGLTRLDPNSGELLWSTPLGRTSAGQRPSSVALDSERLYWIGRSQPVVLRAIDLGSGESVWQRPLAEGPNVSWSLLLADRSVVAFPSPDSSDKDVLNSLPLVFCRRDTGGLIQRLVLSTSAAEVAVRLAQGGGLVATQDGLWGLDSRQAIDAEVGPR